MSMSEQSMKSEAARLLLESNEDIEPCIVYEDESLEDSSEEERDAIIELMGNAKITISWADGTGKTWSNK